LIRLDWPDFRILVVHRFITDESGQVEVEQELDIAIESFFKRIIKQFISSWYSSITRDESFAWDIKVEITEAIREIALRLRDVTTLALQNSP
jgi:PXA domain